MMRRLDWNQLDEQNRAAALRRAPATVDPQIRRQVSAMIDTVRAGGDTALREATRRLDGIELTSIYLTKNDLAAAASRLPAGTRSAMDAAYATIQRFHAATTPAGQEIETSPGVTCSVRYVGIDTVGLYVPGGQTPLPSTALMLGVPAQLAGCRQRVLCSPPAADGRVDPAIAYAAELCEIFSVCLIGGAQAIAAMAFGTDSVPRCDKIFGPGSVWVTEAKRQVAALDQAVTIDMPAGPSEVMVIADAMASPEFVASDLLAQAEHGPDSQSILVTDNSALAEAVGNYIYKQITQLSRQENIRSSLKHSAAIVVADLNQAVEVSNRYAPEHLIIQTENANELAAGITAAGSVFLGQWTPEVLGDYCSGTNHVLPTSGYARSVNGLSVADFMKRITMQRATASGLQQLATTAAALAEWEGLTAHRWAITTRQKALEQLTR